ncbi:MAG: ribosome biogenesis GTP-binding protein YihA/YsxC [Rickettsiales bacterium]
MESGEQNTKFFRCSCVFVAGASSISSLPEFDKPEVAFIGRSNVGKSSLINALVGQKKLARTSQNPGHTKQLNFFLLAEKLMLVDMPGYGYARVSKGQKSEWNRLIIGYLCGRPTLKRACLLIDSRRGIMKSDDEFMSVLDESAVNYQIILTKTDSLPKKDMDDVIEKTTNSISTHSAAHPSIIATSSKTGYGIDELRGELVGIL